MQGGVENRSLTLVPQQWSPQRKLNLEQSRSVPNAVTIQTATECGVFEALKDKNCFDQARLNLGTVTWPNGVDMDPAWMYEQVWANKLWSIPF